MKSRFAHLSHRRFSQERRRIIPGVMLAAATIVAAVLFSASSHFTAQAHDPTKQSDGAMLCGEIGSGSLSVAGAQSVERTLATSDNDCQFSIEVTPPSVRDASSPACTVSYTPIAATQGADVAIMTAGNCDGVRVSGSVSVAGETTTTPTGHVAAAQGHGGAPRSKQAYSRITAHDVAHITMFWHRSKAIWTYANNLILSSRKEVNRYDNIFWHIDASSGGSQTSAGNTRYRAWDSVDWHSGGFPSNLNRDVYAESTATVTAEANGGYSCDYDVAWISGAGWYLNLHWHTQCWGQ